MAAIRIDVHCHVLTIDAVEEASFVAAYLGLDLPEDSASARRGLDLLLDVLKSGSAGGAEGLGAGMDEVARLFSVDAVDARLAKLIESHGQAGLLRLLEEVKFSRFLVRRLLPLIARAFPNATVLDYLPRFLDAFNRPPDAIAESLLANAPDVDLFVPLMTDYENWLAEDPKWYAWASGSPSSDELAERPWLATCRVEYKKRLTRRHRGRLQLFAPFCPLRAAVGKAFEREVERVVDLVESHGFLGVKLYPIMGYYPCHNATRSSVGALLKEFRRDGIWADVDTALETLYAACETRGIPITAHTSPHGARGPHGPKERGDSPGERCLFFGCRNHSHPANWRPVLRKHPELRLNLAHMGGDHFQLVTPEEKLTEIDWAWQITELMRDFPHVYADRSCQIPPPPPGGPDAENEYPDMPFRQYRARFIEVLNGAPGVAEHRVLNGSDWHLVLLYTRHAAELTRRFEAQIASDPGFPPGFADGFFGVNAARFLGLERSDPAAGVPDGPAIGRLAHFYDEQEAGWRPEWWDRLPAAQHS